MKAILQPLELRGGRLWDGIADTSREGSVFTAISDVGVTLAGTASPESRILDVSGCTIIPGLIEAHAHLCFNAHTDWREVYDSETYETLLLRMAGSANQMLVSGITTVRDLGAPTKLAVALREAIRARLVSGPNLLVAGAPITPTGGHCWFLGGETDGLEGVQLAVRERKKAGVDWIKVMATGGNMTPGTNVFAAQYSVEELRAIVAEAHRLELKVTAHAHGIEGIKSVVDANVDMIEHCSFQTPDGPVKDDQVILAIARSGIAVSPTINGAFAKERNEARWHMRKTLMKSFFDARCDVLMSTDCGIPDTPHENLAQALIVISDLAELSPVETMKLATSLSAKLLDLPDRGTIEPGQRADLLIVEGDPTQDLKSLQHVRMVILNGELVSEVK